MAQVFKNPNAGSLLPPTVPMPAQTPAQPAIQTWDVPLQRQVRFACSALAFCGWLAMIGGASAILAGIAAAFVSLLFLSGLGMIAAMWGFWSFAIGAFLLGASYALSIIFAIWQRP